VIYIPMGWPHNAISESEYSIHITIGVNPPRWIDIFNESLKILGAELSILRKSLPLYFDQENIKWGLFDNKEMNLLADEVLTRLNDTLQKQMNSKYRLDGAKANLDNRY
jgi:ribosomal protein L16 Arg81 hydroxylase